jgi:hypothetical protein
MTTKKTKHQHQPGAGSTKTTYGSGRSARKYADLSLGD